MSSRLRAFARSHQNELLVLWLFTALAWALFIRTWLDPATKWVGLPGDPPQHMWFLRWIPHALSELDNPLFTHHINFPDGINLMWNTSMPLPGLLLAPISVLVSPVVAYNVLVTVGVALSGFAAFLMLRRYTRLESAALTGALLYAFSPYVLSQALGGHSNLVQVYIPPLLFLALDTALVRQDRSPYLVGVAMGALASVQFLITEEVLSTTALAALVGLIALCIARPREVRAKAPYALRALATGFVVTLLIVELPLAFQFLGPENVRHGSPQNFDVVSSDLVSFLVPSELQALSPKWGEEIATKYTDTCCKGEWGNYMGPPLILLLVFVSVRFWRLLLVKIAAIMVAVFAVLSLGGHLHVAGDVTSLVLPFRLVELTPVLKSILPRRLSLYMFLGAAVLVAVFVDHIWRSGASQRTRLWGSVALAAAMIPLLPEFPFPSAEVDIPPFFTTSAVERIPKDSVVLVTPFPRNAATSEPMLWQAEAHLRFRMPFAYILGPGEAGDFVYLPVPGPLSRALERVEGGDPLGPDDRAGILRDMAHRKIEVVIAGPGAGHRDYVRFFTRLIGRGPQRIGGVEVWWDVDPEGLLAVTPIS